MTSTKPETCAQYQCDNAVERTVHFAAGGAHLALCEEHLNRDGENE